MGKFQCSVRTAPRQVTDIVNGSLAAKVKLRDIAERTGISKSSISRHSVKCIGRGVLARYRESRAARSALRHRRIVTQAEDGSLHVFADPGGGGRNGRDGTVRISRSELREDDMVVLVAYEEPRPVQNFAVLRAEAEAEDAARTMLEKSTAEG